MATGRRATGYYYGWVRGDRATIRTETATVAVHVNNCQREPTATEIAVACEIIQAGWSPEERDRRTRHYAESGRRAAARYEPKYVTAPTIKMVEVDTLAG